MISKISLLKKIWIGNKNNLLQKKISSIIIPEKSLPYQV